MNESEKTAPRLNVRFLYHFCNDIPATRAFYSQLLGLTEIGHVDDDSFGWVGYDSDGLQLMFFRWDEPLPVQTEFCAQPGDGGGPSPRSSLSIEVPEAEFPGLLERLREAGTPAMTPAPTWRQSSYWGWTVLDPMGDTIELYFKPAQKPEADDPRWTS